MNQRNALGSTLNVWIDVHKYFSIHHHRARHLNHLLFSFSSTKEKASKDDIVMEMKSGKSEEAVLLQGVNGDKKSPTE